MIVDLDDARADWNRPMSLRAAWLIVALAVLTGLGLGGWLLYASVTGGR